MLLHFKKLENKKNEKLCFTKNIHAKLQICKGKLSLNNSQAKCFQNTRNQYNNNYYSLESSELSMTSIFV